MLVLAVNEKQEEETNDLVAVSVGRLRKQEWYV